MIDIKKVKVGDKLMVRPKLGARDWHYGGSIAEIPSGTTITVEEVDNGIPSVKSKESPFFWFKAEECFALEGEEDTSPEEMTLGPGEKLVEIGSLKVGQLFLTHDRDCMAMVTDAVSGPLYDAALVDCGVGTPTLRDYHVCVNIWIKAGALYSPPGTIFAWDKEGESVWVLPE